jgi:hypothetical protein
MAWAGFNITGIGRSKKVWKGIGCIEEKDRWWNETARRYLGPNFEKVNEVFAKPDVKLKQRKKMLRLLRANPGITKNQLKTRVAQNDDNFYATLNDLIEKGLVIAKPSDKRQEQRDRLLLVIRDNPGISGEKLYDKVGGYRAPFRALKKAFVADGTIRVEKVQKGSACSKACYLNDPSIADGLTYVPPEMGTDALRLWLKKKL